MPTFFEIIIVCFNEVPQLVQICINISVDRKLIQIYILCKQEATKKRLTSLTYVSLCFLFPNYGKGGVAVPPSRRWFASFVA